MDAGGTSPWIDEVERSRKPELGAMQGAIARTTVYKGIHEDSSTKLEADAAIAEKCIFLEAPWR